MAQRVEESSVADPPLLLDQLRMHNRDVSGCTAKADPSQLEPEPQRCAEGRSLKRIFHSAAFRIPGARLPQKNCRNPVTIETL
jgi:hypothetical protein